VGQIRTQARIVVTTVFEILFFVKTICKQDLVKMGPMAA
jgi:hypothetical protein